MKVLTRLVLRANPIDIVAPLLGLAGLGAIVLSSARW
jgi:hypothetical protein